MEQDKFGPEDVIYDQGDNDHFLYILLDGEVEIYH
jgi:CRP-like cAMP-binding protein